MLICLYNRNFSGLSDRARKHYSNIICIDNGSAHDNNASVTITLLYNIQIMKM